MKDKAKVLFMTYPWIGLNKGGLQIQIEKTAQELSRLGVEIIFYNPWKSQVHDVDICHVFSSDGSLIHHVERAADMGKPVIISSVFNFFNSPPLLTLLKVRLSKLLPGVYSDLKRSGRMLNIAKRIITLNENEKRLLSTIFHLDQRKCDIVPNGINTTFAGGNPDLFSKRYGVSNFVLQVASIEHRKNQMNLIKAMANLPYPLVLIGQATQANQEYFAQCKRIAKENVLFVGAIDNKDPLLASAFTAAKLFVLPSYSEVMPLTLYEAAIAGCKIVTSKTVPVSEMIRKFVPTINPDKPSQIAMVIDREMKSERTDDVKKVVLSMPSWQDVGFQINKIYENILTGSKC